MRFYSLKFVCFLLLGTSAFIVLFSTFSRSGADEDFDLSFISALEPETEEFTAAPPCSLRRAVRRDVLLSQTFRFRVPVLQTNQSLSEPAWGQLRERAPPYGWKGLPDNVVSSSLSLLSPSALFPRSSPSRCVHCAVVGNGGILRGSGQGSNIDRHDYVFRMNGAITKGFEEDVGSKISFYGFTTNTMKNALRLYKRDGFTRVPQGRNVKYVFIPSGLRDYIMMSSAVQGQTVESGPDKGDRPWKYFGHKPAENFKILHPGFISYVTHNFLSSPHLSSIRTRDLYMPSTGALMLLTALHTCDQVSAFGFITSNVSSYSDHYYDSVSKPLKFFTNHDLRMERRLWAALHRKRVITLQHG